MVCAVCGVCVRCVCGVWCVCMRFVMGGVFECFVCVCYVCVYVCML